MATKQETGQLQPIIVAATDARAVYDAIAAADATDPAEASLKLHLLAVRDRLRQRVLEAIHWLDTRDMLPDGMTKGSVPREALRKASEESRWAAVHASLRTPAKRR